MPDETKVDKIEETVLLERTKLGPQEPEPLPELAPEPHPTPAGPAPSNTWFNGSMVPIIFLLFMILAMVVILVLSNFRKDSGQASTSMRMEDPTVATLRADLEARRSELNRQRIASGLPPIDGGSESMQELATRIKNDADTLVGLSGGFQQIIIEKDARISEVSENFLRTEQVRQTLSTELGRVKAELQQALVNGSEADSLNRMLTDSRARQQTLSQQLLEARAQLAEMQNSVDNEDFADLQRNLEETTRAKDFFENRVRELEAQLGNARLFAKSEDELLPAAVELFRRLRTMEDGLRLRSHHRIQQNRCRT